ncbi:MAG: hypothetical protein M9891_13925 [Austwickia sp.]|nr:hypothetical protein [Austwickia sp.]
MNTFQKLASINPACRALDPSEEVLDERARTDLATILATPRAAPKGLRWLPRPAMRPRWVAVAASVVVIVVAALAWSGLGRTPAPAFAVTPPPLAIQQQPGLATDEAWQRLIGAAQGSTEGGSVRGRVAWTEWSLWTRVDDNLVTSAIVPVAVQRTPTAAGTIRQVKRWATPWIADGAPATVENVHPGEVVSEGELEFNGPFTEQPPTDAGAMGAYLSVGHPIAAQGTPEAIVAVEDLNFDWSLGREARISVLQYLRQQPGLTFAGITRDRLHREGWAFAIQSDHGGLPVVQTVVFDPLDGRLLDVEEMLTTNPGKLNVAVPAVISYTAFH